MSYQQQGPRGDGRGSRPRSSQGGRGRGGSGSALNGNGLSGAGSTRQRINLSSGSYHGPTGVSRRNNPGRLRSGKGNGGYPLRSRNINFTGRRGLGRGGVDRRIFLVGAAALVLVIVLVLAVSSCVRGCSPDGGQQQAESQNQVDSRVAAGVSDDLSKEFKTALDRNDKLSQIAANADKYSDQQLLELALAQPEAIDFAASYPDANKSAQAYSDAAHKGTAPTLYNWDARWGAVDYAGHALALTGSGPVSVSMAYMGLTGSNDKTPADVAALVTADNLATGDSSMSSDAVEKVADSLGFVAKSYTSSRQTLLDVLDAGTYILAEVRAGALTDAPHWVLVTTENENGTVLVHDPTSPEATARAWDPATIASACDTFYGLSQAEATTNGDATN